MSDPITPIAARFDAVAAPLTAIIDAVPANAWDRPSPCDGWAARDVVGHLIDTERDFLSNHGCELGAIPDVADDPAAAWHAHLDSLRPILADADTMGREFDGYFGPTNLGDTIERFYMLDLVGHRWDLARAVGADDSMTDEELDTIETALDGFGDTAYLPGVFAAPLDVPDDADRQTRVLARMGRQA